MSDEQNVIPLTAKESKFITEYLIDLNATQAAIRAGYSAHTAGVIGYENLKKPYIQGALTRERARLASDLDITPEKVLAEYAKLGFANMANYTRISGGDPYIDLSNCSLTHFAAISEVTSEDYVEGRGEDARDVKKTKIKLHDKKGALDSIARHLGMFVDKSQVEMTSNVKEMTPEQKQAEIETILAAIATQKHGETP